MDKFRGIDHVVFKPSWGLVIIVAGVRTASERTAILKSWICHCIAHTQLLLLFIKSFATLCSGIKDILDKIIYWLFVPDYYSINFLAVYSMH